MRGIIKNLLLSIFFVIPASEADIIRFVQEYQRNDLAVVVIDMEEQNIQNSVAGIEAGFIGLPGNPAIQDEIKQLSQVAIHNKIPVLALFFHTNNYQQTEAGRHYKAIEKIISEEVQQSSFFTAFHKTGIDGLQIAAFREYIMTQGITKLVIAGCYTDICINKTIQSGLESGLEIITSSDIVTANHPPLPLCDENQKFEDLKQRYSSYSNFNVVCSPSRNTMLYSIFPPTSSLMPF